MTVGERLGDQRPAALDCRDAVGQIAVEKLEAFPALQNRMLGAMKWKRALLIGDFDDPDGDSLIFSAFGLPPSLSIDSTGVISGTFNNNDVSSTPYDVTVRVTDPFAEFALFGFQITVNAAPPPPSSCPRVHPH